MIAQHLFKVAEGSRLITFLKTKGIGSEKEIKNLLHSGYCTVNGKKERFASRELEAGDEVALTVRESVEKPAFDKKRILYEDEELLAYDKPPFISSLELAKQIGLPLIHRLDKETSGVLLLAKRDPKPFIKQFRERSVIKGYVAIVDGLILKDQGSINKPLAPLQRYEGQVVMGVSPQGLAAETKYLVKKRFQRATMVLCFPVTGRTHQIRVHFASIGHPVLGDFHYGKAFKTKNRPGRILLHAAFIKIAGLTIKAPMPEDLKNASSYC